MLFFFISLLTTAMHLGVFISLAEFREFLLYQRILANTSAQFPDIGFQLFHISALNLLFCSFRELWRNCCLGPFGLYFLCCILSSVEVSLKLSTVSGSPAYNLNTDSRGSARKVTLQSMEFLSKERTATLSMFFDN